MHAYIKTTKIMTEYDLFKHTDGHNHRLRLY